MATVYDRETLLGNTAVSLDNIATSSLVDADFCFTLMGSVMYVHKWDASSVETAAPPSIVIPADTPATGRWIQQGNANGAYETPPTGISVVGGFFGLGYEKASATTIKIFKGSCYDATGNYKLNLAADSTISIGILGADAMNHLFLTDLGDIQIDSDIDGATLLAGSVSQLRYIGTFWTDGSSDLYDIEMNSDNSTLMVSPIEVGTGVHAAAGASATGDVDISGLLPFSRMGDVNFACTTHSNRKFRVWCTLTGLQFFVVFTYDGIQPRVSGLFPLGGTSITIENRSAGSSISYTAQALFQGCRLLR